MSSVELSNMLERLSARYPTAVNRIKIKESFLVLRICDLLFAKIRIEDGYFFISWKPYYGYSTDYREIDYIGELFFMSMPLDYEDLPEYVKTRDNYTCFRFDNLNRMLQHIDFVVKQMWPSLANSSETEN